MKLITPPLVYRMYFPELTWKIATQEKVLYLTFDDGPIPEVTPWVCEELKRHRARATFFCIGDNVSKHPEIYSLLQKQGHKTGSHTFNHLNGWKTEDHEYIANVQKAAEQCESGLFRPPYGKIKKSQARVLTKNFRIIMWDVLSYDFDKSTSPERCYRNVTNKARPGSIIVFHDSLKAYDNLRYALPKVLADFSAKGYRFDALP